MLKEEVSQSRSAAFFALSNRMANLISMRPNPEFYLLGRLPKDRPAR